MKVLAVIPHPDDELWFAGSLILLSQMGVALSLVAMTSGEAGTDYMKREGPALRGEALSAWREKELQESAEILGVKTLHFARFPDGKLEATEAHLALSFLRPHVKESDLVLSLGKDGIYGHRDHVQCTAWLMELLSDEGFVQNPKRDALLSSLTGKAQEGSQKGYGVVFQPGVFDAQWQSFSSRRPELASPHWIENGRGMPFGKEALSIDIRPVVKAKRQAMRAHKSQLRGPDERAFFVPKTIDLMLEHERFETL